MAKQLLNLSKERTAVTRKVRAAVSTLFILKKGSAAVVQFYLISMVRISQAILLQGFKELKLGASGGGGGELILHQLI